MSAAKEFTASSMAARTAAILFVFVIVFTGLLSAAYQWTWPAIEASAAEEKMKRVNEVLPRSEYDNPLLDDTLTLPPTPELGLSEPSLLYRARLAGQPVALVFEAVAPDGYAGKIRLIVAVDADGRVAGVRVAQHRETPGLGDYIELKKDKNKDRPWITQFAGLSLAEVAPGDWKVKKDGGHIDYYAGATVTPRAVAKAVLKAVQWATANRDRLFAEGATHDHP
ncbi:MAG: electron transport complex subunit RsxG [Azonexus sp.]|jgi:electron transport complex protein RnfG|uniref:electron transport complex subunit RsxG n=1 Tax=Azonexus sp. TaxID=1872668 RepID=UPI00282B274B|nr:electron transport complex subunit RsxG [Azonexus sp.]MDR0777081.1 electron transport complex subunit RsxG [Azonexus sp.]